MGEDWTGDGSLLIKGGNFKSHVSHLHIVQHVWGDDLDGHSFSRLLDNGCDE